METRDRTLRDTALAENALLQYGKSDVSGLLYRDSAAFRAYIKLQRLPTGAPAFDLDAQGYPTIHQGECVCRMKSSASDSDTLCGALYGGKAHLVRHVHRDHGLKSECPSGRKRTTGRGEACKFYLMVMEHEVYDGKGEGNVDEA